jgi:hypothetical protein
VGVIGVSHQGLRRRLISSRASHSLTGLSSQNTVPQFYHRSSSHPFKLRELFGSAARFRNLRKVCLLLSLFPFWLGGHLLRLQVIFRQAVA